jgi:hypothetical protein
MTSSTTSAASTKSLSRMLVMDVAELIVGLGLRGTRAFGLKFLNECPKAGGLTHRLEVCHNG